MMEITENVRNITNHIGELSTMQSWTSDEALTSFNNLSPPAYRLAIMWTVDLIIIISNIPLFIVTPLLKNIPDASKIAMMVLGVTDLYVGIHRMIKTTVFITSGNYIIAEGSLLCWLDGSITAVFLSMSVVNLTYISLDRFMQIKYPFFYARFVTKRNIFLIELGTFMYVTTVIFSTTAFYPLYFNDVVLDCRWYFTGEVGQVVAFSVYIGV